MERTNDEFYRFLARQRPKILELVDPFWQRCTRYNLQFCLVTVFAEDLKEPFTCNMRETDGCAVFEDRLMCMIFEASNEKIIPGIVEKIMYKKDDYFKQVNTNYFGSIVCSSFCEGVRDTLINQTFMVLEYAYEYKLSNQILTIDVLPR